MSYAAAGAVAPGPGTTAGYVNYKALFDSIFATFNADDAIIAAATSTGSLANAGKLAKFAGDGGLTLAGAFSAVNGAFGGTLNATGNTGLGGTLAVAGNATLSGTLHVVGVSTFDAAITGTLIGTASGLTAPVSLSSLIADYKPATSGSAGQIVVGAGPRYGDSAGNIIGPLAAQAAPLSNAVSASQPTGTNSQYVVVSLAPGTGAPVATGGAVAAGTPVPPVYPTANEPIALVLWRGATTNPTNVIAAGDITDLRGLGGSGGGGSAGADSGVRASALWLVGTNAGVFSGAHDSTNASGTETGRINSNLVNSGNASDALVSDLTRDFIPLTVMSRLSVTGAVATLTASAATGGVANSGPVAFSIAGRYGVVAANISSGSATLTADQPRYVFLGIAVSGTPTLRISSSNSAGPYEAQLCTVLVKHDASGLDPAAGSIDWTPLFNIASPQLALQQWRADSLANDTNILANGLASFTRPANTPVTAAFTLARQSRVRIRHQVFYQIQASTTTGEFYFLDVLASQNSGTYVAPTNAVDGRIHIAGPVATGIFGSLERMFDTNLAAGTWTLAQAISYTGAAPSTGAINLLTRYIVADVYAG